MHLIVVMRHARRRLRGKLPSFTRESSFLLFTVFFFLQDSLIRFPPHRPRNVPDTSIIYTFSVIYLPSRIVFLRSGDEDHERYDSRIMRCHGSTNDGATALSVCCMFCFSLVFHLLCILPVLLRWMCLHLKIFLILCPSCDMRSSSPGLVPPVWLALGPSTRTKK
ncbi:hypothetical protein VTN96DRAFT_6192 [Rasamsonia emersonii]